MVVSLQDDPKCSQPLGFHTLLQSLSTLYRVGPVEYRSSDGLSRLELSYKRHVAAPILLSLSPSPSYHLLWGKSAAMSLVAPWRGPCGKESLVDTDPQAPVKCQMTANPTTSRWEPPERPCVRTAG